MANRRPACLVSHRSIHRTYPRLFQPQPRRLRSETAGTAVLQVEQRPFACFLGLQVARSTAYCADHPVITPLTADSQISPPAAWLLRIAKVFEPLAAELLDQLQPKSCTRLGSEFYLVTGDLVERLDDPNVARYLRWKMPVHHSWPCCPRTMPQFIEKASQALLRKFGEFTPQALLVSQLDPNSRDPYYRKLAANLRGRALQVFPPFPAAAADEQDGNQPSLFCLVGHEGLFCGLDTPRNCHGFHPGGTKFITHNSSTISRAGAKIAEALHFLRLYQPLPTAGAHWLELGASPGGMTAELLARGYRVTAIDRAPMDARLDFSTDLTFIRSDAAHFHPAASTRFDAILCDMNGETRESIEQVIRLAAQLVPGGLVIFTLKTAGASTLAHFQRLADSVAALAASGGLRLFAQTHLTYNRREFTAFFRKDGV